MAARATTISDATEDDLPVLAQVVTEVHGMEAVMAFVFKDWPEATTISPFMTFRIRQKFANPKTKIVKITYDTTGEILGLAAATLETGDEAGERDIGGISNSNTTGPPPEINLEFAAKIRGGLRTLDELMVGKMHYVVSLLAISSKHQGKVFGTKLMKFCSDIADEAGLPIFMTAFPGAHDMYMKLGYKRVSVFEIDLNHYGRKSRGFGVYRWYGMLRLPVGSSA